VSGYYYWPPVGRTPWWRRRPQRYLRWRNRRRMRGWTDLGVLTED
jgi:hypothetical protein